MFGPGKCSVCGGERHTKCVDCRNGYRHAAPQRQLDGLMSNPYNISHVGPCPAAKYKDDDQ